jgi:cytochrome-b5 reductase
MFARSTLRTFQPLRCQAARRYTTINAPTPPPPTPKAPKSGPNAALYVAGAAGVGGLAYYYFGKGSGAKQVEEDPKLSAAANAATGVPTDKKAFTEGDQGFIPLKLETVEDVNHNTKRFRFKLPEDDMVSGLVVASAILTKFKPEGAEKPIIRPYTPISDEGKCLFYRAFCPAN